MNFSLKDTRVQYTVAALIIIGAVFLLFHDLFFGKIIATNDVSTNDLLYFYLPIKALYAEALKNGELLQWTPYIYGGFPVFAEGQGGFLYPLNLIIWYFLSPVAAMNTYILVHALIMGFGVYFLVSKLTENNIISIPSGAAAAICGSIIAGHTRHLNSLTAIVYLPWLIYTIELFLRTRKVSKGLIFGILLGLLILGGHPQHSFISGFFAVLYLAMRLLFDDKTKESFFSRVKSYKVINFLLLAIIASLIIGFPQIKSTLELLPFTERGQELTSQFTGIGSMPFKGLLTFIYPYYMGDAVNGTYRSEEIYNYWEFFYYSGVIVFILAIYGTVKMWKRREFRSVIRSLVIIAIVSYLLALGENLGLYKIFTLFPFTKSFRFPARWFAGTELAVLALSGFGVLSFIEMLSGSKKTSLKSTNKKTKPQELIKDKTPSIAVYYKAAIFFSIAICLEIFIVAGGQVVTADPAVYLNAPSFTNMIHDSNRSALTNRQFSLSWRESLTASYDRGGGWEKQQNLFGLDTKLLPPNMGAYFHVPIIDGYLLLVPNYIYEVWGDANHPGIVGKTATLNGKNFVTTDKFVKLSKMCGVKYISSAWNFSVPFKQVWDSLGIKEYELQSDMNKAWVVSKTSTFLSANENENALKLIDDNFDPWSSAFVTGSAPMLPADSKNGSAEVLYSDNHSLTIKANEPGFVVINDTWYPKWKAYIDGNEVPVYKTNVMMRGVVAPKAGTIIEMRFDKGNVFLFAVISYVFIFLSIGYLYFEKRKQKYIIKEAKI